MTKSKRKNAFTLIELLTTISIMALLLIVSIPAFGKLKAQEELDNAAEDVKQMILEAQNLAMAPNEEMRAKGIDYTFIQKPSNSDKKLSFYLLSAAKNLTLLKKDYNLPDNLNFRDYGSMARLYFTVPDARIPDKVKYESPFLAVESSRVSPANNIRYIKVDVKTGKITVSKTK